ncbi:MAG: diguanylate cyclase [Candidatus Zixiibacteriota bacterium]
MKLTLRVNNSGKELYRLHQIFGLRAKEELKRAERYSDFLSLIVIDITSLIKFARKYGVKNYDFPRELLDSLEKTIIKSVRETDIVSGIEQNKLGLLLFETPLDGANCLTKRLGEKIKDFVTGSVRTPQTWQVPMEVASFPEKENSEETFLSFLRNHFP